MLEFLDSKGIEYVLHEHPAVFTCEDAEEHCSDIPGLSSKNLMLKDVKGRRFFLLVLPADKRADLSRFCEIVGEKKVTFANERELSEILGVNPGAVSPFGLINDKDKQIEVFVDSEVYEAPITSFHPNRNTASIEIKRDMFKKFLDETGHEVRVI